MGSARDESAVIEALVPPWRLVPLWLGGRAPLFRRVRIDDMDRARRRLEAEREHTLRRLDSLTEEFDAVVAASRDTNADDEHDPEGATIAFERSQTGALVRQAQHHLAEIDAATKRLDAGTYGACEGCGRPIGEGRLAARPAARTCIQCATSSTR